MTLLVAIAVLLILAMLVSSSFMRSGRRDWKATRRYHRALDTLGQINESGPTLDRSVTAPGRSAAEAVRPTPGRRAEARSEQRAADADPRAANPASDHAPQANGAAHGNGAGRRNGAGQGHGQGPGKRAGRRGGAMPGSRTSPGERFEPMAAEGFRIIGPVSPSASEEVRVVGASASEEVAPPAGGRAPREVTAQEAAAHEALHGGESQEVAPAARGRAPQETQPHRDLRGRESEEVPATRGRASRVSPATRARGGGLPGAGRQAPAAGNRRPAMRYLEATGERHGEAPGERLADDRQTRWPPVPLDASTAPKANGRNGLKAAPAGDGAGEDSPAVPPWDQEQPPWDPKHDGGGQQQEPEPAVLVFGADDVPPGRNTALADPRAAAVTRPAHLRRNHRRGRATLAAAAAVVVAGAAVGAYEATDRSGPTSPVAAKRPLAHHKALQSPAPTTTVPAPTTTVPPFTLVSNTNGTASYQVAGSPTVVVAAHGPCWVQANQPNAQGNQVYAALMAPGQSETLHAPVWIRLGAPSAVTVTVNGASVPALAGSGAPWNFDFQ